MQAIRLINLGKQAGHKKYCLALSTGPQVAAAPTMDSLALLQNASQEHVQPQCNTWRALTQHNKKFLQRTTHTRQHNSLLCSGSLLIYPLHCGSVSDCTTKYKSKGSCSNPYNSTEKTSIGHPRPCSLFSSLLLAA